MRTVHETEALRPSDPIPKNHSGPPTRPQRLKLILSAKPPEDTAEPEEDESSSVEEEPNHDQNHDENHDAPTATSSLDALAAAAARMQHAQATFPPELGFTDVEMAMPPKSLYRLLRRQLHWAEEESAKLKAEVEALEKQHQEEWILKELALEQTLETELAHQDRRRRKRRNNAKARMNDKDGNGKVEQNGDGHAGVGEDNADHKPTLLPTSLPRYFPDGEECFDGDVDTPDKKVPGRSSSLPRFLVDDEDGSEAQPDFYLDPEEALFS